MNRPRVTAATGRHRDRDHNKLDQAGQPHGHSLESRAGHPGSLQAYQCECSLRRRATEGVQLLRTHRHLQLLQLLHHAVERHLSTRSAAPTVLAVSTCEYRGLGGLGGKLARALEARIVHYLDSSVERCLTPVRPAPFGPCGYSEYSHRVLRAPEYGPSPPTRSTPARASAGLTAERRNEGRAHTRQRIRREGITACHDGRSARRGNLPVPVPPAGPRTHAMPHRDTAQRQASLPARGAASRWSRCACVRMRARGKRRQA